MQRQQSTFSKLDPPPSEAEIDDVLARMAMAPLGASEEVQAEARRLLHSRFEIRMDLGATLTGEDEHEPWLDARRASIEPFYWTRYREYLLRKKAGRRWSPARSIGRQDGAWLNLPRQPCARYAVGTARAGRYG